MSSSELFVLSSDFEGMPNALLEAMCLGVPVISTKVAGAVEVIEEGENGLLVDIGDETGLANAMERLLEDGGFRYSLGRKAIQLADALNITSIVSAWKETFDIVIKNINNRA